MQLRKLAVLVSLCACVGASPAKEPAPTQVQDGIAVRPLSRWRMLAPSEQIEAQALQQYNQLMQKAASQNALAPNNHPEVVRLRTIAKKIIPYATRWNPEAARWKWEVNLLGSDQVNAFCMPGGKIAFFSGILTKLRLTDDEVAAIMGHEMAHALREHSREQFGKSAATSIGARLGGAALAAVLGIDPRVTDTVAQYGAQFASLKYGRDDERESDLIGLDLAARAGYDPRAGVALWQKMASLNQAQPMEFMSTHPSGADRIRRIQDHMDVLLPLYARAKGTSPAKLPAYRTASLK
jgi:Zn-dependent protease with chaperone function